MGRIYRCDRESRAKSRQFVWFLLGFGGRVCEPPGPPPALAWALPRQRRDGGGVPGDQPCSTSHPIPRHTASAPVHRRILRFAPSNSGENSPRPNDCSGGGCAPSGSAGSSFASSTGWGRMSQIFTAMPLDWWSRSMVIIIVVMVSTIASAMIGCTRKGFWLCAWKRGR